MTSPVRIQLKRTKGWRKPLNCVVVARPGKWGNPFRVGKEVKTQEQAVASFEKWYQGDPFYRQMARIELRGKNLACWCAGDACHAEILLKWANEAQP